jgi:hypothetical protein
MFKKKIKCLYATARPTKEYQAHRILTMRTVYYIIAHLINIAT